MSARYESEIAEINSLVDGLIEKLNAEKTKNEKTYQKMINTLFKSFFQELNKINIDENVLEKLIETQIYEIDELEKKLQVTEEFQEILSYRREILSYRRDPSLLKIRYVKTILEKSEIYDEKIKEKLDIYEDISHASFACLELDRIDPRPDLDMILVAEFSTLKDVDCFLKGKHGLSNEDFCSLKNLHNDAIKKLCKGEMNLFRNYTELLGIMLNKMK